jgi:hypothetical protein
LTQWRCGYKFGDRHLEVAVNRDKREKRNMEKETEKPAFMIASVNVAEPEKMGPYLEAAGPLFAAAGIEVIALGVAGSS